MLVTGTTQLRKVLKKWLRLSVKDFKSGCKMVFYKRDGLTVSKNSNENVRAGLHF